MLSRQRISLSLILLLTGGAAALSLPRLRAPAHLFQTVQKGFLPQLTDGFQRAITVLLPDNQATDCFQPGKLNPLKPETKINVGVVNTKAIELPKPSYPAEAKAAGISGVVKVLIVVDEGGRVVWARALTGHPLLRAAAMKVVCGARFHPTLIDGPTLRISGILSYKFLPLGSAQRRKAGG